jgi:tetratricopeptide (TPR) repeat protein
MTPIHGIRYYTPPKNFELKRLGERVEICLDLPLPLQEQDFYSLEGGFPEYDMVGRGLYHALCANPDCIYADRFATVLSEFYPHYIAELASQIVLLDHKDVDVPYLDRKINFLKIFTHLEPHNHNMLRELAAMLVDRGLSLSALDRVTVTLYQAEKYYRKALALAPDDFATMNSLGEVCYLLGKYDDALALWRGIMAHFPSSSSESLQRRIDNIMNQRVPRVPAVDYLEAVGIAFELHQREEFEEAAAILQDVLDDGIFCGEYPLPALHVTMGVCCSRMGMMQQAREFWEEALKIDPEQAQAKEFLEGMN